MSFSHRSGPLKQSNKKHKLERKRSESRSTVTSFRSIRKFASRRSRRATAKQRRFFTVSTLKRILDCRGTLSAPFWCVFLPLTSDVPVGLAKRLVKKADPDADITDEEEKNLQRVVYIRSPLLDKHFAIVTANPDDIFACIDLIHVADWVVVLVPSDLNELDSKTESFLTALYSQGLGDVSFAVMSSNFSEKSIKKNLLSRFPVPENTIYPFNTPEQAINLLRHVTSSKKKAELLRRNTDGDSHSAGRFRAKMLVDAITLTSNPDPQLNVDNSNSMVTYLKIQGLLRGSPLYFDEPLEQLAEESRRVFVYLTGWGDFPLVSCSWKNKDTTAQNWSSSTMGQEVIPVKNTVLRSSSVTHGIIQESSEGSDSIESRPATAAMDGTISGLGSSQGDGDLDEDRMSLDDEVNSDELSTFCARTMVSSRMSFSNSQLVKFREARAEELFPDEVETPMNVPARERFNKYRSLPNFQNSIWPFEKDILPNQYDNIACFRNYHRNRRSVINYLVERCRDLECNRGVRPKCIPPDVRAQLTLGPMSHELASQIINRHGSCAKTQSTPPPLVAWSLLPHENRISICHFTMKRVLPALQAKSDLVVIALAANKAAERSESLVVDMPTLELGEEAATQAEQQQEVILNALSEHRRQKASIRRSVYNPSVPAIPPEAEPIKSKELMVFQAGIRRFITAPVYSTQTTSSHEKAKYEPYFPATHAAIVASVYAPVMYSPVNVSQFRIRVDEDEFGDISAPYLGELVATGTLHSVDPARLIVKRIFLSGHPYRIRNRHVVARFMFFNPLDVEYFKTVRLQTKSGAVGHITESVGTHGAMKCTFDKPIKASDVILMPLYKRIFPKWLYQPTIVKALKAPLVTVPTHQWRKAPDVIQLTKKKSKSTTSSTEGDTLGMEEMEIFD